MQWGLSLINPPRRGGKARRLKQPHIRQAARRITDTHYGEPGVKLPEANASMGRCRYAD